MESIKTPAPNAGAEETLASVQVYIEQPETGSSNMPSTTSDGYKVESSDENKDEQELPQNPAQKIEIELLKLLEGDPTPIQRDLGLREIQKRNGVGLRALRDTYEGLKAESEHRKAEQTAPPSEEEKAAKKAAEEAENQLRRKVDERAKQIAASADVPEQFKEALSRCCGYIASSETASTVAFTHAARLLERTTGWVFKGASSSGKTELLEKGAQFLPPERVIRHTSLSAQALAYFGSLAGMYMLGGELEVLKPGEDDDAQRHRRQLISDNRITRSVVEKDETGALVNRIHETFGPVVLAWTTTRESNFFNDEFANRLSFCEISDDPDLTEKVLLGQADSAALRPSSAVDAQIQLELEGWREYHRRLKSLRVQIPFAKHVKPRSRLVTIRRQFPLLLNYVRMSTLLHQATREKGADGESSFLIADVTDYERAYRLITINAPRTWDAVSDRGREVFESIRKEFGEDKFTRAKLQQRMKVSEATAKRYLSELLRAGCLKVPEGEKFVYQVGDEPEEAQDLGFISPAELRMALGGSEGLTVE